MYIVTLFYIVSCILLTATTTPVIQDCQPGYELVNLNSSITCKKCKDNYFSKNGVKCSKCSTCSRGQLEQNPCMPEKDRYCKCPKNQFLDIKRLGCSQCRTCPPGMKQVNKCLFNRDRECEECPKGYTTNTTNSKTCSVESSKKPTIINNINNNNTNLEIIIPLVSIVGVMLLVCAFWLWRKKKRSRARRQHRTTHQTAGSSNNELADTIVQYSRNEGDDYVSLLRETPDAISLIDVRERNLRRIVELQDYDVINQLSLKLNPTAPNDWRELARRLNINEDVIKNIDIKPMLATENLIHFWGTSRDATVAELHNTIVDMGRSSVAILLRPYIYIDEVNGQVDV